MTPPTWPSDKELEQAERFKPGSGAVLIDQAIEQRREYTKLENEAVKVTLDERRHAITFKYAALIGGLILSAGSLITVALAIQAGADIGKLAAIFAAAAGAATVFLRYASPIKHANPPALPSPPARRPRQPRIAPTPTDTP